MVCVDFDGTITNLDTFDLLVEMSAGVSAWRQYEKHLASGKMSLRQVLHAHARLIRGTTDQVDSMLARRVAFDPAFAPFVRRCKTQGIPLLVLSSGIGELIRRAMARNGLADVEVRANEAHPSPDGWEMRFRDDSDNGHDKAAAVRALQADGKRVAFVGDGFSDFEAAEISDVRFARAGHGLERYLKEKGVKFTPFSSFTDVERELLG